MIESVARAITDKYGVSVKFAGTVPMTDGKQITLPVNLQINDENKLLLRGYLDHESAHVLFSNFRVVKKITNKQVHNLTNIFEDIRIEKKMAEKYIGSGLNLRRAYVKIQEKMEDPLANNSLILLNELYINVLNYPRNNIPDKTDYIKSIFGEDIFDRVAKLKSTNAALKLAEELIEKLEKKNNDDSDDKDDNGTGDGFNPDGDDMDNDSGLDGEFVGADEVDDCDVSDEADDIDEADSDEADDSNVSDKVDGDEVEVNDGEAKFDKINYRDILGDFNRELDLYKKMIMDDGVAREYRVYSKDGDLIEKPKVDEDRAEFAKAAYRGLVASLENFNSLKVKIRNLFNTTTKSRWEFDKTQGKINNRQLATIAADNNRVFKQKVEGVVVDTAVQLVVDLSGSMGWDDKLHNALKTIIFFIDALSTINGLKVEVIGFTTLPIEDKITKYKYDYSRIESLYMPIIKGFDEPFSEQVKMRIGNIHLKQFDLCRNNVDGESIDIAYHRLLARKEKRKIMIVISDGVPAAYGDSREQSDYLKKVIKKIEANKAVELIGLGYKDDSVKTFYKNNIIVKDANKLIDTIYSQIKEILKK